MTKSRLAKKKKKKPSVFNAKEALCKLVFDKVPVTAVGWPKGSYLRRYGDHIIDENGRSIELCFFTWATEKWTLYLDKTSEEIFFTDLFAMNAHQYAMQIGDDGSVIPPKIFLFSGSLTDEDYRSIGVSAKMTDARFRLFTRDKK